MTNKIPTAIKSAFLEMDSKAKLYLYLAVTALTLIVLVAFTMIYLSRSELEDCVKSGVKPKTDYLSKLLQESGTGETPEEMEYRIRIQCMRAIHGK